MYCCSTLTFAFNQTFKLLSWAKWHKGGVCPPTRKEFNCQSGVSQPPLDQAEGTVCDLQQLHLIFPFISSISLCGFSRETKVSTQRAIKMLQIVRKCQMRLENENGYWIIEALDLWLPPSKWCRTLLGNWQGLLFYFLFTTVKKKFSSLYTIWCALQYVRRSK